MTTGRCLYLLPGALVAAAWAVSGSAAPLPRPTPEQIARWVKQLGDNDFAAREEASRKLWAAGEPAEAALHEAAKSDDAEVSRRARDILDKFRVGIYPDTPKELVEQLLNYQAADAEQKAKIVVKLAEGGAAAQRALRKLVTSEEDVEVKRLLFGTLARELPLLLAEDNREALEPLLEAGLHVGSMGPGPYAAYWMLRGKLDERIASFEAQAKKTNAPKTAEVLAYLYRARGDLAAARRAAEKAAALTKDPDEKKGAEELVQSLLYEAADWNELARLPSPDDGNSPSAQCEKWGFRAAFNRLAGNDKDFEAALAELRKLAEAHAGQANITFSCAKAFFLNDRPAEALEWLARSERPAMRFEILCTQHKYADALAVAEKARDIADRPILEDLEARTLYLLGDRDRAQALFTRRAAEIKEGAEPAAFEGLLEDEYRAGLKDQAFEHCARLLEVLEPKNALANLAARPLLAKVFPDRTDTAVVWWVLLRHKYSTEDASRRLRRLRDLLDGKKPAGEVKPLVEEAERGPALRQEEEALRPAALAEVAHAAGLDELARSCLEKAGTGPALLRLGDLLAERKQWERAAESYRQAWDKDRREPLPQFLAGWALDKAGQSAEGKKRMEQSHWLPLGDEASRYAFLQELGRRGHLEGARREADLLRRVGRPAGFYVGGALRRQAVDAAARKDYRAAARDYELAMLHCLHPSTSFVQPGAYVGVPALVHRLRAAAELSAGKIDAARREIALSRTELPGGIDLAVEVVPLLERRGFKKDADQLFADTLAVFDKLCRDYPRCAWAHNSAAWLSACCRRNLDGALAHAQRAVELAPDNAGHLDTLAEVLFQRGEKDKAIATQKRVIELDPKKPYFRKQLRRLEAGDPSADRPAEDDD